ncbi:MAG: RNA polymerase sigma factor [Bryobacterales bacterium]|nr:RNA polymerase sigma factor [Bryobacterales bacterium]
MRSVLVDSQPGECLTGVKMTPVYAFVECCAATRDSNGGDLPLLKCAQAQDQIAFREIVERLQSKIFLVCYALLESAPEGEAVAERVFVRLYHRARPAASQQDLTQYTYRLAIDQCLAELRLRRVRKLFARVTRSASIPDRRRLPETDEGRRRTLALHCLAMLPKRERVLLVLREVADQAVEDIANIMRMDPVAVRKQLFSARQRLLTAVSAVDKQGNSA